MIFNAKTFDELINSELYEIIRSRAKVFLLEQKIMCLDADGVDYDSLHCFVTDGNEVTAYLRAFSVGDDTVSVGRVLTLHHGRGDGKQLMEKSIKAIKKHFNCKKITLHAQKHVQGFYKKLGFKTVSDEFMEEGVVHVIMEIEIKGKEENNENSRGLEATKSV